MRAQGIEIRRSVIYHDEETDGNFKAISDILGDPLVEMGDIANYEEVSTSVRNIYLCIW